ncbi:MAG: hypothetical protein M1817_000391 [Caeruleum heppii]|nr:MAG: hypothetical protein M1817_000391 [Caeruleum heppii]
MFSPAVIAALLAVGALANDAGPSDLPIVDLKHTVQQASAFDSVANLYNFSNIRYGEPPLGDLRFAAPVAAKEDRTVQNGAQGRICYQANPAWTILASQIVPAYLIGNISAYNLTSLPAGPADNSSAQIPLPDDRETEDCLFLDVVVPKRIFDERETAKAPVLVWIHGGGYTAGHKQGSGNPVGLIGSSQDQNGPGVVYVSINYRLGAFGWLSGPTLQSNGSANAGLLDQRLALEWIQNNIHAFGGDKSRVTVLGESAGGGSIMHQITAYGGLKGPVPFQQAVLQSPGWAPTPSSFEQEKVFVNFLRLARQSSIQEVRSLPSWMLRLVNYMLVAASPYGSFTFNPVVDGSFVPALPGKLLLQGSYDKSLKLMLGTNANEGLVFTPPTIINDLAYRGFVRSNFPTADESVVDFISATLYPPTFDNTPALPYKNQIERTSLTIAEVIFTCNTYYLSRAFGNDTYNYVFSVPPALHGQDVPYTFAPAPQVINQTVAAALQDYITQFAESGQPNEPGVPRFDLYEDDAQILNLGLQGFSEMADRAANDRCLYWQKGLFA